MNGGIVKVWVGKNLPKFLNSYQKSDSLQNYSRPIIGEIFSEFICFQKKIDKWRPPRLKAI